MRRLIAIHALGYSALFGLLGLNIALTELSVPTEAIVAVAISSPTVASAGEQALSEGLGYYKAAVTQEGLGMRAGSVLMQLERARANLQVAIRLLGYSPRLAEAYYLLGDSYLHGDIDPVNAERHLLKALDIDESHFRAAVSLARTYGYMGLPIQESTAWERALAARPFDSMAHRGAALAYWRSNLPDSLDRAYDHAVTAIRHNPSYKKDLEEVLEAGEGAMTLEVAEGTASEPELAEIIDRGRAGKLSDAEAEKYAEEIARILGGK